MTDEVKSTYLSLDAILGADDLEERDVEIPSWGGSVRVKALSRASVRRIYRQATDSKGVIDQAESEKGFICMGMVSPAITPATYAKLDAKKAGAVQQLLAAILDVSGMTPDATEKAADSFREEPGA